MPRLAFLALLALVACGPSPREPFTLSEQVAAAIPGIPDARAWGDAAPRGLDVLGMRPAEVAARRPGHLDYLALSSGGPAGAYGAGILVGWGESGTRPVFDVVTGVSSGALVAPFAFVGDDVRLREVWTEGAAADLGRGPNPIRALTRGSLLGSGRLQELIATYVDDAMIAAIAQGHREGRRLLVVTTNLDAQRPVVWNLGAIAASGAPGSANLLRAVLLASASIPVAFPPVYVDAVAGGRTIREMHADGGTSAQIFAFPDAALVGADPFAVPRGTDATLWAVATYVVEPEFGVTPPGVFGVGQRAYGTLIKSDLRSELVAIADTAGEAGMDFRLASVGETIAWSPLDPFSTPYMRRVFELGRQAALDGTAFAGG